MFKITGNIHTAEYIVNKLRCFKPDFLQNFYVGFNKYIGRRHITNYVVEVRHKFIRHKIMHSIATLPLAVSGPSEYCTTHSINC